MIVIQRKLKAKYTGEDQYKQDGIDRDKWMNVIGIESRKRLKKYEGKEKWVDDLFLVVINNNSKACIISAMNMDIRIDDGAELQGGQATQLMQNILTLLKVMSEKMGKNANS